MGYLKYLKIFDRTHVAKEDEVVGISELKYTWTLNGFGKIQFNIGLENPKCTPENFQFGNHLEIWDDTHCVWGGKLINRQFNDSRLEVAGYGYLSLIDRRRMRAKSYANMSYADLFTNMLADINAIYSTNVSMGSVEYVSLKTQRAVLNTDFLLPKLQDFCADSNYDFDVDDSRNLNFYLHKGEYKADLLLEYGGDADNILIAPVLLQDYLNISNSVYGEVTNGSTLSSLAEDATSKNLYGLQESLYSGNDSVILQNTLDNNVISELQRMYLPVNYLQLTIKDSARCPFDEIEVGDSIPISLKNYWGYTDTLRILEMTHDEDTQQRELIVGETLLRYPESKIKYYRR